MKFPPFIQPQRRSKVSSSGYFLIHGIAHRIDLASVADIIFLDQRHALNSGLLPLAATYSKPVVCPDIGCFKQSMEDWLCQTYAAGDVDNAVLALQNMCNELADLTMFDNSDWLRKNSWDGHVNGILRALADRTDS